MGITPQGDEESRNERVAEERGGREVVYLPLEHRSDEQRIDQVVRMVDAEEHRTRARHPRTSTRSKKNQIQNRANTLTTP
jgi:hypothetical protein